jgi:hypothetical protein
MGGGAIMNDGTLTISSSNFISNKAGGGGAICGFASSKITITGSTFIHNQVSDGGGAIVRHMGSLTINACTFINNKATYNGGAIWNDNGNLKISNSKFINNIAGKIFNSIYNYKATVTKSAVSFSSGEGKRVTTMADLKITKIVKKGISHFISVKNAVKVTAKKSVLGVYYGSTLIKTASVKAIKAGNTLVVKVLIPTKYRTKELNTKYKTFKLDIKNAVKESNEINNSKKAK